jgi:hypothetical protein
MSSLNENEKAIWDRLETELLAEEGIRKAEKSLSAASNGDPKKVVIGALLLVAGLIGLVISVINSSMIGGLAAFLGMLFGTTLTFDYLSKMTLNSAPKNKGFSQAYENLKNYKPRNNFWNN